MPDTTGKLTREDFASLSRDDFPPDFKLGPEDFAALSETRPAGPPPSATIEGEPTWDPERRIERVLKGPAAAARGLAGAAAEVGGAIAATPRNLGSAFLPSLEAQRPPDTTPRIGPRVPYGPRPTGPPPQPPASELYTPGATTVPGLAVETGANVGRAFAAGLARSNVGVWGTIAALAEDASIGEGSKMALVRDWARKQGAMAERTVEAIRGPQEGAGRTERSIYQGIESVGQNVPGLVLSLLSGGATAAAQVPTLGLMGLQTGGESYVRAREAGKSHFVAMLNGVSDGAIEVATELLPVSKLLEDVVHHAGLGKIVWDQLITEVPGEQVATFFQDLNEWTRKYPEKPFSDYLAERPGAFWDTLVSTVVSTLVQSAIGGVAARFASDTRPEAPPPPPPPPGPPAAPVAAAPPLQPIVQPPGPIGGPVPPGAIAGAPQPVAPGIADVELAHPPQPGVMPVGPEGPPILPGAAQPSPTGQPGGGTYTGQWPPPAEPETEPGPPTGFGPRPGAEQPQPVAPEPQPPPKPPNPYEGLSDDDLLERLRPENKKRFLAGEDLDEKSDPIAKELVRRGYIRQLTPEEIDAAEFQHAPTVIRAQDIETIKTIAQQKGPLEVEDIPPRLRQTLEARSKVESLQELYGQAKGKEQVGRWRSEDGEWTGSKSPIPAELQGYEWDFARRVIQLGLAGEEQTSPTGKPSARQRVLWRKIQNWARSGKLPAMFESPTRFEEYLAGFLGQHGLESAWARAQHPPPTPAEEEARGEREAIQGEAQAPEGATEFPFGERQPPPEEAAPPAPEPEAPAPAPQPEPERAAEATPETRVGILADEFHRQLQAGTLPTNPVAVRAIARRVAGGDPTTYVIDTNDALEEAFAREARRLITTETSPEERIRIATELEAKLPRALRSLEKLDLQQFSTPLPVAAAVANIARVQPGEIVLEPTAGTGNLLAVMPEATPENTTAVEMSPRRAEILRRHGYNVIEGDFLKATGIPKADVIVSNPPWGKYGTGKYGSAIAQHFKPGDISERFGAWAIEQHLKEGGRIVLVMPTTTLENSGAEWRNWLVNNHTVLGRFLMPPEAYRTRATNVGSVVWLIEKGQAEPAEEGPVVSFARRELPPVVTVDLAAWTATQQKIEAEYAHRPVRARAPAGPRGPRAPGIGGAGPQAGAAPRPGVGRPRPGEPAGQPAPAPPERGPAGPVGVPPVQQPGGPAPGVVAGGEGGAGVVAPAPEAGIPGAAPRPAPAEVPPETEEHRGKAKSSSEFAPYPRRTQLDGPAHPKLVVEARQLAGVPYPPLTIQPHPKTLEVLKAGRVSVEQFEQAMAAVQANIEGNHGYLAADNVGVGKSRELALVLLDLMHRAQDEGRDLRLMVGTRGRDNIADLIDKELYYVATGYTKAGEDLADPLGGRIADLEDQITRANRKLRLQGKYLTPIQKENLKREIVAAGAKRMKLLENRPKPKLPFEVVPVIDLKNAKDDRVATGNYEPPPLHKHAIYLYDLFNIRDYRQAWRDIQPHGIVGDEVHKFKNVQESQAGAVWQEVHGDIIRRVPRDEQVFAYFSATPAQTVADYQYLYGLRLWPLDGFADWVAVVTGHATEQTAKKVREDTEKGAGNWKNITGADVAGGDTIDTDRPAEGHGENVNEFAAHLTPAEGEQITREMKLLGRFSSRDLWREGTEFVIHEAKLPEKHKAAYNQFVAIARAIQATARKFGRANRGPGGNRTMMIRSQLQFAAKRMLMEPSLDEALTLAKGDLEQGRQPVISLINVNGVDFTSEKGNLAAAIRAVNTRQVDKTRNGDLIDRGEIPEALVAIAELKEMLGDMENLPDPIIKIEDTFGAENVAAIIGDNAALRQMFMREFQRGERKVLVISAAGATGLSAHHITWTEGGDRGRRSFYDTQFEWSATDSLQRYGRVDRAGQLTAPKLVAITFGNASEKKFLAAIAGRMASLGALSMGGAEATGKGAFEEFELDSPEMLMAMREAWQDLPERLKQQFTTGLFIDAQGFPRHTTNAMQKDFGLELQLMEIDPANEIWKVITDKYKEVITRHADVAQRRAARSKGEVLRKTDLRKDLQLTEVKTVDGEKFGIVSGLVTPEMPNLRHFITQDGRVVRRYDSFTDTETGVTVSGLHVRFGQIRSVAKAYGHLLGVEKLDTAAKVLEALHAGDRVTLLKTDKNGEPWVMREHTERFIVVEGVRMADRAPFMEAGGAYREVGNLWIVKPENMGKFLERYPVKPPELTPEQVAAANKAAEEESPEETASFIASLEERPTTEFSERKAQAELDHLGMLAANNLHDTHGRIKEGALIAGAMGSRAAAAGAKPLEKSTRTRMRGLLEGIIEKLATAHNGPKKTFAMRTRTRRELAKYHRDTESFRWKTYNDIESAAHEVGHALHDVYFGAWVPPGFKGGMFTPPKSTAKNIALDLNVSELGRIASAGTKSLEGFAEFVRLYVTDEKTARKVAPQSYVGFERKIGAENPEVLADLLELRRLYNTFAETPVFTRLREMVHQEPSWIEKTVTIAKRPLDGDWWHRFYQGFVSEWDPVSQISAEMKRQLGEFDAEFDPKVQATTHRGQIAGVITSYLNETPTRYRGNEPIAGAKNFRQVIEPVIGDLDAWGGYMVLARSVYDLTRPTDPADLTPLGQEGVRRPEAAQVLFNAIGVPGNTLSEQRAYASKMLEELETEHPEFVTARKDFQKWNGYLRDLLRDSGILSPATADYLADSMAYVPWNRWFEAEERPRTGMRRIFGQIGAPENPLRRLKKSGRDFENPMYSILANLTHIAAAVQQQRLGQTIVQATKRIQGGGRWIVNAEPRMMGKTFKLEAIERDLRAAGLEPNELQLEQLATYFSTIKKPLDNEIVVWSHGKPMLYEVASRGLLDYMKTISSPEAYVNVAMAAMRAWTQLERNLIVLSPRFAGNNFFRDQFAGMAQTGVFPGRAWLAGIASVLRADEDFQKAVRSGRLLSSLSEFMYSKIRRTYENVTSREPYASERFKGVPGELSVKRGSIFFHPIELLRFMSLLSEDPTRQGLWNIRYRQLQAEPGMDRSEYSKQLRASVFAKEGTVNFDRRGLWTKKWSSVTKFMNPSFQGADRFTRTHIENARRAVTLGSVLTFGSIVLRAMIERDPERKKIFNDLDSWVKNASWTVIVPSRMGGTVRHDDPQSYYVFNFWKPFEWGFVYSTIPERLLLDHITPKTWKKIFDLIGMPAEPIPGLETHTPSDLMKGFITSFVPPLVPDVLMLGHELSRNKNWLNWLIVRRGQENISPPFQYVDSTSMLARKLGRVTGVSPMQIDYVLKRGHWGKDLVAATDWAYNKVLADSARTTPAKQMKDIPLIGGFFARSPSAGGEPIERFWKFYEDATEAMTTKRFLEKQPEGGKDLEAWLSKKSVELTLYDAAMHLVNGVHSREAKERNQEVRGLHDLSQEKAAVLASNATPIAKRLALDQLTYEMLEKTTAFMQIVREARETEKATGR